MQVSRLRLSRPRWLTQPQWLLRWRQASNRGRRAAVWSVSSTVWSATSTVSRGVYAAVLDWSRPDPIPSNGRWGRRAVIAVWALAVIFAFIGFGTSVITVDARRLGLGLMPFIGAVAGLPFGFILARPMLGWLLSWLGTLGVALLPSAQGVHQWPWPVISGLVLLALMCVCCARQPPARVLGVWLATALLFLWGVAPQSRWGWLVGVTVVALVGLLSGRLRASNRALSEQAEVSAQEKSRRVILEERTRIARDLHDIVAHHMSLVAVQAETASFRVPDLGPQATTELQSIATSARAALTETRSLLGVLRNPDQAADHAPAPGLADVADLIEATRRSGARITLGAMPLPPLSPGVSLAGYRVVQESLTNATRHAPGTPISVTLSRGDSVVVLEVHNGPSDAGAFRAGTPGHGITGMRERVATADGRVDIGPTPDGGWRVRAELPAQSPRAGTTEAIPRTGLATAAPPTATHPVLTKVRDQGPAAIGAPDGETQ